MTPIFAFAYGISFAAIAAVIVHTILYQGREIFKRINLIYYQQKRKNDCETISIIFKR